MSIIELGTYAGVVNNNKVEFRDSNGSFWIASFSTTVKSDNIPSIVIVAVNSGNEIVIKDSVLGIAHLVQLQSNH